MPLAIVGNNFCLVWDDKERVIFVEKLKEQLALRGMGPEDMLATVEAMDAEENAAAVMQGCLVRIENGVLSVAMDQWLDVVHFFSQAAVDARQAQAMRELEAMKEQVEKDKEEKAGRLMQYCLNKIINTQYVQAWDRWMSVHKAMLRAGRIMHRTMSRMMNSYLVCGWDRWMEVWEAEKHAAAVMQQCMNRITDGALVKG